MTYRGTGANISRTRAVRALLLGSRAALCCAVSCGLLAVSLAATNTPEPHTPAGLVKAALESELAGPSDVRNRLLGQALKADPNFAPARWQSGFVRFGDQWVKVDDVPKHTADDKQLAAYRKMRDGLIDTADNHRALAKWCRKNKLAEEERIHWAKVLEFDQSDAEALSGLGLQVYQGRLLTRAQIEQEKIKAGNQHRAMQHWQPQLVKWRAAIEHGSGKSHDEAVEKLKAISDLEAIPALEAVFAVNGESKKSTELNLLLIETVGRMQDDAAPHVLVRRAIYPQSSEVRCTAARMLRNHPLQSFVPLLLGAMPPLGFERQVEVNILPDGAVILNHQLWIKGLLADKCITYQYEDRPVLGFRTPVNVPFAIGRTSIVEARLEAQEQYITNAQLTDRVETALLESTNFEKPSSPEGWLSQLNAYTESYVTNFTGRPVSRGAFRKVIYMSCFPAGTPVLTASGASPIEKIRPGDRVLAQKPETGELAYKTVQGVTLRPAAPLVKIGLGSATISATRGHPFWVNGEGWRMAKQLKVGQYLHSLAGAVLIDSIEEAPAAEAYNLVVSDFDTYFVGEQQVLVHDNLPIQETAASVPGLAATVAAP